MTIDIDKKRAIRNLLPKYTGVLNWAYQKPMNQEASHQPQKFPYLESLQKKLRIKLGTDSQFVNLYEPLRSLSISRPKVFRWWRTDLDTYDLCSEYICLEMRLRLCTTFIPLEIYRRRTGWWEKWKRKKEGCDEDHKEHNFLYIQKSHSARAPRSGPGVVILFFFV